MVRNGWVSQDQYLAGYGAAQAIPGPMFSFSAYLGLIFSGDVGGPLSSALALIGIFLQGFLPVSGVLPLWRHISQGTRSTQAIAGINAAVIGILGAALYDPIFVNAIRSPLDLAIGLIAFMLLAGLRLSPLYVVAWCSPASVTALFLT